MKTRICQDTGCSKMRKRSVSKDSRLKNDGARRTRTRDGLRAIVLPRRVRSINGDTRNATRWKSEREQTTTHGSAITCRWRDISRQRPREVAPRDGRCMTTHIKKNSENVETDSQENCTQDWMSHVPGWSPGTHGTTYEPPAATAAKAPGYQTTMRSRRTLVNCEIYTHTHRSAITGRWRDCSR